MWKEAVQNRMSRFRLTIHPGAHPRPVSEGIPFLGFVVFPQQRRLKRRKGINFRRKFWQLLADYADGLVALDQVTASVQGWVNHVRYGNTVGLRRVVISSQLIPAQKKRVTNG